MPHNFTPLTPLYHESLDARGLAAGTRVWMASGSFHPIEEIEPGDHVFGITFQIEDQYVDRGADRPADNIVKVWRPVLTQRKVLGRTDRTARAWQLTFGDAENQYESRRLVAGGATRIKVFPLAHDDQNAKRLVDCYTAVDNPRAGSERREAMQLDREWSAEAGEPKYRPTPFTGMPRGEHATIIPFEIYGGQTGMLLARQYRYNRYVYAQVREVIPLVEKTQLIELELQADTDEKWGLREDERRCNLIAQTPFAPETKQSTILTDQEAQSLDGLSDSEDFAAQWDDYARSIGQPKETKGTKKSVKRNMQGQFYDTQKDDFKEGLKNYGVEGGWLNGGILIDMT